MSDKAAPFYKRINWLVLTAETIAIVFGVLLALGVDEWREENQIQKNIERARARLTTEVIANRNELKNFTARARERLAQLKAMHDLVDGSKGFVFYKEFYGFPFPDLKDSVWQRVSRDPLANRMAPDFIEGAFNLYYQNELQNSLSENVNNLVYSPTYNNPDEAVHVYWASRLVLSQQISWADDALEQYDAFVEQFNLDVTPE